MSKPTESNSDWNEYLCLGALLTVSLAVGTISSVILPYYRAGEYADYAMQLVQTGHITDTFLPILYPTLLAFGYRLFHSDTGFTAVNILLSLIMLASAWLYLRLTGLGTKFTLLVVALLSLYPDFSLSYNKTQDTNLTAIALFMFLSAVILTNRDKNRIGYMDLLTGVSIGFAALVRPNLILLVPVSWLVLSHAGVRRLVPRFLVHLTTAAVLYCSITILVHGSMFFPRNGPYNLYAGYNPYTSQHIWNEEDSIYAALPAQHVQFTDDRDPKLDPIYKKSVIAFIRHKPGYAIKLDLLKFVSMMLPDFHSHAPAGLAGGMKIFCALAIPLWIIAMIFGGAPRGYDTRFLLSCLLVATLLPFCLIISTQRFRVPLDFICWADLGATLLIRQTLASKEREISPVKFTEDQA
jgi:hypothetical protein